MADYDRPRVKLHTRLFIALVAGIALGAALHSRSDSTWINAVNANLLRPIGQIFLRSIFMRLRPSEPLRLALIDSDSEVKVRGVVAWSSVESANGALAYRAGVEFINPDALSLDAFCVRRLTTAAVASK